MKTENNHKPLYLLFDFDGTIADSFLLALSIANELSLKYGYPQFTEETINEWRGLSIYSIFQRLKIPFYKIPLFVYEAKKSLNSKLHELKPIEGVPEILHELKARKIPMAMLTSNAEINVLPFLNKYDINVFDWSEFDVGLFNKANRIKRQMRKRHLHDYHCIYIGDETRDIAAARHNHIPIISVCWGLHPQCKLQSYSPDYLIQSPKELLNLITSF
jgi:phosphoglycolate phosphatase-like HAD superfamily hydrolase